MKFHKKTSAVVLALCMILSLFALIGCSSEKEDNGETKELKVVRIGGFTADLSENASSALHLGYLDEELEKVGYKAEYTGFPSAGPAMNEALASDQLDVGVYADFPHLVARSKGVDIRAFAAANSQYQYALVVQPNINSVKDLEGKKVVFGKGTILERIFQELCEIEGADVSKIEVISATADEQSLFASGETDAIMCILPAKVLVEQNSGGKTIFTSADYPALSATLNVVGSGKFLDENPEAAKAIVRALYRSYDYLQENPDKAYEALATEAVPVDLQKKIYTYDDPFKSFSPEFDAAAIERIEKTNDFLFKNGIITEKIDINGKYLDLRFVDEVKKERN